MPICPRCGGEEHVFLVGHDIDGQEFDCGYCQEQFWLSPTGVICLQEPPKEVSDEEAIERRKAIHIVK